MGNDILRQKLGEIIYMLGEHNFNIITAEGWQKYINEHQEFTEDQIKEFSCIMEDLLFDLMESVKNNR